MMIPGKGDKPYPLSLAPGSRLRGWFCHGREPHRQRELRPRTPSTGELGTRCSRGRRVRAPAAHRDPALVRVAGRDSAPARPRGDLLRTGWPFMGNRGAQRAVTHMR